MPPPDDKGEHDTDPLADTQASVAEPEPAPAVKARAVAAGDVLGRYELVEEVGEGGMATVYRARDRELRREVAVKVLFPHLARRTEVVHRFQREARAAAGLDHRNILRIHDVGGGDGGDPPYIVMELVRGRSLLAEIEQRGPLLAELAACVGALVADALGAAHAASIVHRDVKPANVLVASAGQILLADFGVARLETEDSLVTKTGAVLGTPAYMSPEQASGDIATAKSDLYSLGAMLYQLATGALPFVGSQAKILAQIAQGGAVPAVKRSANVGPDLSRAIEAMMRADAAARPASAADIARELRAIAAAGGLGDPVAELAEYFADRDKYLAARTPVVVGKVLEAGERALAEDKLPRALALADRASVLAPDDPRAKALVSAVTEGGRARARRRVVAIAGAAVVVAGAGVGGVIALRGGGIAAREDAAAVVVMTSDASTRDATPIDAAIDAAVHVDAGVAIDARPGRRVDAGMVVPLAVDAAVMAIDAGVPIDAAPRAPGAIKVTSDAWCDVKIDDVAHGRATRDPIRVEPGHHTIVCEQTGTGRRWSREVDVTSGETKAVAGTLLATVAVTFAVDATIDKQRYARGSVVHLPAGRYQVTAGATTKWLDLRTACTIQGPELDCYP